MLISQGLNPNKHCNLQYLLPHQLLPKTKNLTYTTSHLMMIKAKPPYDDPNKQSASGHPKVLPALPSMMMSSNI